MPPLLYPTQIMPAKLPQIRVIHISKTSQVLDNAWRGFGNASILATMLVTVPILLFMSYKTQDRVGKQISKHSGCTHKWKVKITETGIQRNEANYSICSSQLISGLYVYILCKSLDKRMDPKYI